MTEDNKDFLDEWIAEMGTPAYKNGEAAGYDFGAYDISQEALRAYDMGEIELWIDLQRSRSWEDWIEWENIYGDPKTIKARWSDSKE